eukprot:TRINITY_DN2739_c0_g1_i4.p1 TRINITY_DN2739_c0_g1~~TRINITY_DN2739_c0_g1_i4.p1  ORF type:complete len:689 (+),score=136.62 TRINITY_DN2739_c0_g1_i4:263-2068(+)
MPGDAFVSLNRIQKTALFDELASALELSSVMSDDEDDSLLDIELSENFGKKESGLCFNPIVEDSFVPPWLLPSQSEETLYDQLKSYGFCYITIPKESLVEHSDGLEIDIISLPSSLPAISALSNQSAEIETDIFEDHLELYLLGDIETFLESRSACQSVPPKKPHILPVQGAFEPAIVPKIHEIADNLLPLVKFDVPIYMQAGVTGTSLHDEFPYTKQGDVIANQYVVIMPLAEGSFSKVLLVARLNQPEKPLVLKVVNHSRISFNQSLDELRILQYVSSNTDSIEEMYVQVLDHFYFREHLIFVMEYHNVNLLQVFENCTHHLAILRQKILEFCFGTLISKAELDDRIRLTLARLNPFRLGNIQRIAKRVVDVINALSDLKVVHGDIKPENVVWGTVYNVKQQRKLFGILPEETVITLSDYITAADFYSSKLPLSVSADECRVLDFGSAQFLSGNNIPYIQSRPYRAPEVLLNVGFSEASDMWSLGCLLVELWTGTILFPVSEIPEQLAKLISVCGKIPADMLEKSPTAHQFITKNGLPYYLNDIGLTIMYPHATDLETILANYHPLFLDFIKKLLIIDPKQRLKPKEALNHPFFKLEFC